MAEVKSECAAIIEAVVLEHASFVLCVICNLHERCPWNPISCSLTEILFPNLQPWLYMDLLDPLETHIYLPIETIILWWQH